MVNIILLRRALAFCVIGIGLLQMCHAERQIIVNENDFYGSCTTTCEDFGVMFDKKGCSKISGCRFNSAGWVRGFVRCDYCACNCVEDLDARDVTIENKPKNLDEEDLYGVCTRTCESPELDIIRSDYMGCQEVRNCTFGSQGYLSGFVRCDHCICDCINRRYAVSYELTNIQYDLNGIVVYDGVPTALGRTDLVNKDPNQAQTAKTTIAITHSVTETMTTSKSLEIGLSVSVSAGVTVKGIFEFGGSITTSVTSGWTYTSGSSKTDVRTYSTTPTIIVPPSSTTTAIISGSVMKIDIPYTADLVETFEDGTKSSPATISGVYSDVETGRFTITYEEPIGTDMTDMTDTDGFMSFFGLPKEALLAMVVIIVLLFIAVIVCCCYCCCCRKKVPDEPPKYDSVAMGAKF